MAQEQNEKEALKYTHGNCENLQTEDGEFCKEHYPSVDTSKIIPSFTSYGEYSSSNYGLNSIRFDLPNGLSFYFSYSTLVAFNSGHSGFIVRKNDWSTTTGKHLNWIDGGSKDKRIDEASFNLKLADTLKHYGLYDEKCLICGENLHGQVRVHHHHRDDCKELHDCATDTACKGKGQ